MVGVAERMQAELWPRCGNAALARASALRVAGRVATALLHHAALVAPLGARGALALVADLVVFEQVVAAWGLSSAETGAAPAALRALRAVLVAPDGEAALAAAAKATLPCSVALHHLFARTRIPPPARVRGVSVAQYAAWLLAHPEQDAVQAILAALAAYAQGVAARGEKQYDPLYPAMLSWAQRS
jgi:hypothetical protein